MSIIDQAEADLRETSSHRRFAVMDGLRGIAALAVVLLHSFLDRGFVTNGQLAVDFFFILSGFVIAYSYEPKLKRSMGNSEFLLSRFTRLYPMVFLGALGGIAIAFIHNKTNPAAAYPPSSILSSGGLSLLVLPYLSPAIGNKAFSFNPPLWSLFFEVVANIFYVCTWRRLSKSILTVLTLLGLVGVVYFGPLGGGSKATIIAGLPRVTAGFFGGVLLFRLWSEKRLPKIRSNIFVLGAAILAIFCVPYEIGGLSYVPTYAAMWFIVLGAVNARPARFDRISEFLGDVSYPVYLVHWLTLYIFTFIGAKAGFGGSLYPVVAVIHLIAIPFIGFAVGHYYEKPVRQVLKNKLLRVGQRGFFTGPVSS
jgi:peptidoglycan/LPS O-acetylase OafA/YrhL